MPLFPSHDTVSEPMSGLSLALLAVFGFLLLSLLPIGLAMLSGPAAAGAAAGFAAPLQHFGHLLIFLGVGLVAARLPEQAAYMLPLSFTLMLGIGALTDISLVPLPYARVWLFAFALLYAMVVSVAFSRAFLLLSSVGAAFAYYLGATYVPGAPDVASLGYFVLGVVLSVGLIMACGVSAGIATLGYGAQAWPQVKTYWREWRKKAPVAPSHL